MPGSPERRQLIKEIWERMSMEEPKRKRGRPPKAVSGMMNGDVLGAEVKQLSPEDAFKESGHWGTFQSCDLEEDFSIRD